MKAISDSIELLHNLECLVKKMEVEIDLLRNINYRYYLRHGGEMQGGVVRVPKNISFGISIEKGKVQCLLTDYEKLNVKSNYWIIKNNLTI